MQTEKRKNVSSRKQQIPPRTATQTTRARKEREQKETAVAGEARLQALHGPDWNEKAGVESAATSPELQKAGKFFLSWLP